MLSCDVIITVDVVV